MIEDGWEIFYKGVLVAMLQKKELWYIAQAFILHVSIKKEQNDIYLLLHYILKPMCIRIIS